jgi:aminoglycoside 6'-N-acetyltransferase I
MHDPSTPPDMLSRKPWLLAIARRLATEYTAVREPVPERLAALLKKLEGPAAVSLPGGGHSERGCHGTISTPTTMISPSQGPQFLGGFNVRKMGTADRVAWVEMRGALWPAETLRTHSSAIDKILAGEDAWGFIAESLDAVSAGFAELAVRKYANGCETQPVPFLEGIFVKPQFRRQRIGARLMEHVEAVLSGRGFHEIGSDALISDRTSHAAHLAWGFSETERVVYFRKRLNPLVR